MNWISVKDRLPNEYECVLIYVCPDGLDCYVTAGYCHNDGTGNTWWEMNIGIDEDWVAYEREMPYWMPLPKGPNE